MDKRFEVACNAASRIVSAMIQHGDFGEKIDFDEDNGEIIRVYKVLAQAIFDETKDLP